MKRSQFLDLNQGKLGACVAFATANVIYFDTKEKIDPVYLYKKGRKLMKPDIDGLDLKATRKTLEQYYDFETVATDIKSLKKEIDRNNPLVIAVKIEEIDPTLRGTYHAVVLYKIEGDICYFANSWDSKWGPFNDNSGYFRWRRGAIKWAFDVIPNSKKTR